MQDKTREYFEREFLDFNAAYKDSRHLGDVIRRLSYRFNKGAIEGRLNALLDLIGDNVKRATILDVGCGPGFYSIRLAEKGAQVTGIDYSHGMIDTAKNNAQQSGVRADFKLADFMSVDLDTTFDYVFATGVLEYITSAQHEAFLQRMAYLSNGIVIVSFPKRYVLHALFRKIWLSLFKNVRVYFFSEADIHNLSASCGLREIERRDIGILWVIKFQKI
jgi:2-polyprenyl-3-methyl-5-hydroxy-6-metoxy-1,4-benzoquinol methylase